MSAAPSGGDRVSLLPSLASLACAVALARMGRHDPRYLVPAILVLFVAALPLYLARRRVRRAFLSGDVQSVLASWHSTIERVMWPETMAPLMTATAYAAYGWVDAARRTLDRAVKGPAWDAALEQRLFIEALLDTFQGDRASGLLKAEELVRLPLATKALLGRMRANRLRRGVLALARAFSHKSDRADSKILLAAGAASPLLYWAMRYGAAVVAIDRGDMIEARSLIAGAPDWPEESAFRVFDAELRGLTVV